MSREVLKSPVTGVVWKVQTSVGQSFDEGATLILIESMKMEIPVDAPRAGRVVEVLVKEGDAVSESQAVAEIE